MLCEGMFLNGKTLLGRVSSGPSEQPSCWSPAAVSWLHSLHGADSPTGLMWKPVVDQKRHGRSRLQTEGQGRGGRLCTRDRQTLGLLGVHHPFLGQIPNGQGTSPSLVKVLSTVGTVHLHRAVRLHSSLCNDELRIAWCFWNRKLSADNIPDEAHSDVCTTKISWQRFSQMCYPY